MEELKKNVMEMTGAWNATIGQLRAMEAKIKALEDKTRPSLTEIISVEPPPAPRNELELRELSRLPDCVKELQTFDGNPTQYVSWVHSVETILNDYEIVRNKPIYRAILQSIRQKVRGNADSALVSYNIFDNDWGKIKECLSLHYADKRDIRTLEHQLNQLHQRGSKVDEFYAAVNHKFSLIINKIKTENYSKVTVDALIETYRNRALDVFVRGLNGELSRLLIIQRPKTLPEAYAMCMEMQNLNLRSTSLHPFVRNQISVPFNAMSRKEVKPELPPRRFVPNRGNFNNSQFGHFPNRQYAPPRPFAPKPQEKMEVDQSIKSRKINYMNRPGAFKRNAKSENMSNPFKQQRLFYTHTHTEQDNFPEYEQPNSVATCAEQNRFHDQIEESLVDNIEDSEINFMSKASLQAYHI